MYVCMYIYIYDVVLEFTAAFCPSAVFCSSRRRCFCKSRQRFLQITAAAFTNHGGGFCKSRQRLLQITAAMFYKSRRYQITAAAFANHGSGFYKSRQRVFCKSRQCRCLAISRPGCFANHGSGWHKSRQHVIQPRLVCVLAVVVLCRSRLGRVEFWSFWVGAVWFSGPMYKSRRSTPNHGSVHGKSRHRLWRVCSDLFGFGFSSYPFALSLPLFPRLPCHQPAPKHCPDPG